MRKEKKKKELIESEAYETLHRCRSMSSSIKYIEKIGR